MEKTITLGNTEGYKPGFNFEADLEHPLNIKALRSKGIVIEIAASTGNPVPGIAFSSILADGRSRTVPVYPGPAVHIKFEPGYMPKEIALANPGTGEQKAEIKFTLLFF